MDYLFFSRFGLLFSLWWPVVCNFSLALKMHGYVGFLMDSFLCSMYNLCSFGVAFIRFPYLICHLLKSSLYLDIFLHLSLLLTRLPCLESTLLFVLVFDSFPSIIYSFLLLDSLFNLFFFHTISLPFPSTLHL